ncbi:discoidin domain-containing protein [Chitinophaga horti]|uniref:Discoidin domain-containing protein n=1 Tax=Chitinophaga horti TaxID=2920382 RepID=A0ABY6J7D4_9BACT|nr:discoidin domain-containing protein [Chitinophaga horti]UYQ94059.1 discoidin domain-containing protein [Chitinophaga horti]
MKKYFLFILISAACLAGCGKPEAVTFKDRSTIGAADRTAWTITASTQETTCEPGGAALVLDNNINTFWHSAYCDVTSSYPHWLSIDMQTPIKMVSVDITARQNNANGMTRFRLEGSVDGTAWTMLRDSVAFVGATKTPQSFAVSSATAYRYLKMTALTGPTANTFLAEINVFTAKEK